METTRTPAPLAPPSSASVPGSLEPWECFHPVADDLSARPWLGMEVTSRPDGGGWPLEKGIVHEGRGGLDNGWFRLVNDRYPDGIGCHTQEVYPPGFTGCTLPCCLLPNA